VREDLRKFLVKMGLDLIVKVSIERRLENEYGESSSWDDETKRKTSKRVFVFRKDGTFDADRERVGTWTTAGS